MDKSVQAAKERYQSAALPEELPFAVAGALRTGERQHRRRRALHRTLATALSACACFVLLLNVSPGFARAVCELPVLGQIARIFTVKQYAVHDRDHLIDVRLPALSGTGHTDLEQRINTEIQVRIDGVIARAEQNARDARDAYVATGGTLSDFIPVIIDVDYEIKCQSAQYLSFVITSTETQASAYSEFYPYTIDLQTGKEVTLRDLLGSDWRERANEAVRTGIATRSENPDNLYFTDADGMEGFRTIRDDQPFYLNAAETPVVVFAKYEIAPGYMGAQEFEVPAVPPAGG